MSDTAMLRAMIGKEVRTLFRERGQFFGMIGGLVAMLVGFAMPSITVGKQLQKFLNQPVASASAGPSAGERPATAPQTNASLLANSWEQVAAKAGVTPERLSVVIRWVVVLVVMFISLFIAIMFGTTMAVAAFVGEREAGTIEVLLASPLTPLRLFTLKCLSVVVPATVATLLFVALAVAALLLFAFTSLPAWLTREIAAALVACLPLPLMFVMLTNGLCICASIRAETVKGAGQMVGVMLLLLIMPMILVPALMLPRVPAASAAVGRLLHWWLDAPFATQYLLLLGIMAALSLLLFVVGYLRFDRERMLT